MPYSTIEVDESPVVVQVIVAAVSVGVPDEIDVREGAVVSMIMALLFPREFAAPGEARVRVALLEAASRIVPEFRARAEVLV